MKKYSVFSWSEDAWDPALGYILMDSVKTTDKRFDVEGLSTAIMYLSSVSAGACRPTTNSPQTLRVEALSLSNSPKTSVSLSLNLTFGEDIQSEGTRTVDLCTNSGAGSGRACGIRGWTLCGSVTFESVLWCTLVVVLDQELHPNQIEYVLLGTRAVLDSSGKPFVGLACSDFKFAVA